MLNKVLRDRKENYKRNEQDRNLMFYKFSYRTLKAVPSAIFGTFVVKIIIKDFNMSRSLK